MRFGIFTAVLAGLVPINNVAADQAMSRAADAMTSLEWRDCAGYFWYLAAKLNEEGKGKNDEKLKRMVEHFQAFSYMAIYASDDKAKSEREAGLAVPLGRTLRDPRTGGLSVDMGTLFQQHKAKAAAEGKNAYVTRYKAKCYDPTHAYWSRFLGSINKKPQSGSNR